MKRLNFLVSYSLLVVILGLGLVVGCAPKVPPAAQAPAWVTKGSAAFNDNGVKVFYGVGSVSGVKNKSLAKTASENRARAEIAKIFETYTASLMRDYMASTTGGAEVNAQSATSEEQHIEQAVKTFSATTLSGVMVIDHWTDPSDGTVYSLVKLDLDAFKNSLDKAKELNSAVRDFVRKNAEKSFDRLEAEEKKK
ncbi:MAG: LPP20 family lipoprotein [Nitrospirae bacterium]|nr:LPP20 family lipoprotein [Nitrospirota bacterium]